MMDNLIISGVPKKNSKRLGRLHYDRDQSRPCIISQVESVTKRHGARSS